MLDENNKPENISVTLGALGGKLNFVSFVLLCLRYFRGYLNRVNLV